MSEPTESGPRPFTPVHWLICVLAAIGFAFDTYVLLLAPLVIPPAIGQLGGYAPGTKEFNDWVSLLFFVPAVCGGIFGLLGGYLTDQLGRRRVLTGSILLYALAAAGSAWATSLPMLLALRCLAFVGVCVEFVAAVAWLAELFPHQKQKEAVLGWTQATGSLGGVMVTSLYAVCVRGAAGFPEIVGGHEPWRYLLISGVIPAIPLILIRPFVPESPEWQEKKAAGTLRRPSIGELFQPRYLRTTLVTTIIMACGYGAAFGGVQQIPRIVPTLPQVTDEFKGIMRAGVPQVAQLPKPDIGPTMKALAEAARKPKPAQAAAVHAIPQLQQLPPETVDAIIAELPAVGEQIKKTRELRIQSVQFSQETGGLVGRILLAILALFIVSRRGLLRVFQIPGLLLIPVVFYLWGQQDLHLFRYGVFFAGLFTVAQFSFWGNYLPRVYPLHLRGTGESFAANIGGRLIGTSAAAVSAQLSNYTPGANEGAKLAVACAIVTGVVYLVGVIASFWLPEPKEVDISE
jgi:MFS family permease